MRRRDFIQNLIIAALAVSALVLFSRTQFFQLGTAAGEQILKRVEKPDAPIFEKVLTSTYKPYNAPQSWNHSER